MLSPTLLDDDASLLDACRARGVMLATAENCTGGLIAAALTAIAGASDVVDRGFITYSNESATELVGVPAELIARHGAVSEEVARAMADGALARSRADGALARSRAGIAVSVTGVAGPGGGSMEQPVGLACFGLAQRDREVASEQQAFPGDRTAIRAATVARAFAMIRARL